jgi:hypothetical protein
MIGTYMKYFIFFLLIFAGVCCVSKPSLCEDEMPFFEEPCYIDNNYVLLYKIINWWNDALPQDEISLCGNALKCVGGSKTSIAYSRDTQVLQISNLNNSFDLLSIFKECDTCVGPSYLKCTWLNKKYFNKTDPSSVRILEKNIKTVYFNNINEKQAKVFSNLQGKIRFVVEGRIGGLLLNDGRIALHPAGSFLKKCPRSQLSEPSKLPISLSVINIQTGETIALYTAIYRK